MKPELRRTTFGEALFKARKKSGQSLQVVAAQVRKRDGEPITHQYLSELENDKSNPPSDEMIEQLAVALKVSRNHLFYCAGRIPPDFIFAVEDGGADAAFRAMKKELQAHAAA